MCKRELTPTSITSVASALSEALAGGRRLPGSAENDEQGEQDVRGSRRTRLWELPSETHCPLIGVCLPMPALRRLIAKALGSQVAADDYDFHVAAVSECTRRMPIAEALQRELDRRYAPALRRFAQAKTTAALATLWAEALRSPVVAGALWATLTHPRCDEALRDQVCRDIHMFQHQVGACNRADLQRTEQLRDENDQLTREMAEMKERHARALAERSEQAERLKAELMRVRVQVIARDSMLASVRSELEALRATAPDLASRSELAAQLKEQRARQRELEHERDLLRQGIERETARADAMAAGIDLLRDRVAQQSDEASAEAAANLRDKAVLCVGGRTAIVPVYRQLIECTGGKFLHHDGGEENSAQQLEANLAAADLVICQTGCISHDAYWRVKDHCKRTGKRCMFVDKPSAASFERCLQRVARLDTD